jgi:hypothetical protein
MHIHTDSEVRQDSKSPKYIGDLYPKLLSMEGLTMGIHTRAKKLSLA